MNCKFCNAELEEGAVYCPQCGKRIDGKKRCEHCGRYINENSVFCTYCGTRTDGKSVCRKCGEAYDGSFCPKCGTPAQPNKASYNVADAQPRNKTSHILAVTKQSVLYGALCVLFIFSFFVTFSLITTTELIAVRTDINSTSFYFLITQFQEISDFLSTFNYYPEMSAALYLNAGICAACVAAIIIICATYFAIGTAAYIKNMRAKKEFAMSKYVITPALLTLALVLFLLSFASASISQDGTSANITLGATTIVNIVLVSVALATAAVLHIIINAKTQKQNLLNYVLNAVGLVLVFLLLATLSTDILNIDTRVTGSGISGSASAPLILIGILAAIGMMEDTAAVEAMTGMLTNSAIVFALFVLTFAAGTIALIAFAKGILNKNSARPRTLSCVFSAVSAGLSIAYLIMCIILCSQNFAGAATLGASPICALIFSIFALVMSIVNCTLLRNREKAEPYYTDTPDYPAQYAE